MNKTISTIVASLAILFLMGCSSQKATTTGGYENYEVQCLGVNSDGSQTLISWGAGRSRSDAIEQAKINAVHAVLFDGIHAGNSKCDQRPLVNIPNAEEKYRDYFQSFLAEKGPYRDYISMQDEKYNSRNAEETQYNKKVSVTVTVLRTQLRERLQEDNILPKN